MKTSKTTKIAGARLSLEDYVRLRRLAEATGRTQSSVIRFLIRMADVEDLRRIRLTTTHREEAGDAAREADDAED